MFSRVRLLLTISIGLLVLAACGEPVPPATGFDLSVTVVGDGVVTSAPAGIDTAADKTSANFAEGEVVTLTAAPTGTATFINWTGGPCDGSTDVACAVELNADTAVTANFTEAAPPGDDVTFTVTVVNQGAAVGSVSIDPEGDPPATECADSCDVTVPENTTVTLTASATSGGFAGWTGGDCDGQNAAACTITVNAAEAGVTATFNDIVTTTETITVSQVVEQLVNASTSDATKWPAGHNYTDSSDLDFGYDPAHGTQQWIGLRFDFVELPAGANIQSAVVTMTANAAASDAVNVVLSGELVPSPAPFVDDPDGTGSADASTRAATSTTATVDWAITDAWAAGDAVTTPDLATIVQEVVDQLTWGGSLVLFASPDAAAGTASRPVVNVLDTATDTLEITVQYVEPPAAAPASN